MSGASPMGIILANILVNGAAGILPTIAILIVGVLILRRLPKSPRPQDRAKEPSTTRTEHSEDR